MNMKLSWSFNNNIGVRAKKVITAGTRKKKDAKQSWKQYEQC